MKTHKFKVVGFVVMVCCFLSSAFAQQADPGNYCTSFPTNSDYERIDGFYLGAGLIDYSTASCQSYQDLTSIVAPLQAGKYVTGSITLGNCTGSGTMVGAVFIDWNGDFDFDDAYELVFQTDTLQVGLGISAYTNFSFTVPTLTDMPQVTMMRVIGKYVDNIPLTPCGTYLYGHTIDFSIQIKNEIKSELMYNATAEIFGGKVNFDVDSLAAVDYDGDGDQDIQLFEGYNCHLLENIGGGYIPEYTMHNNIKPNVLDPGLYFTLDKFENFPSNLDKGILIDMDKDGDFDFVKDGEIFSNTLGDYELTASVNLDTTFGSTRRDFITWSNLLYDLNDDKTLDILSFQHIFESKYGASTHYFRTVGNLYNKADRSIYETYFEINASQTEVDFTEYFFGLDPTEIELHNIIDFDYDNVPEVIGTYKHFYPPEIGISWSSNEKPIVNVYATNIYNFVSGTSSYPTPIDTLHKYRYADRPARSIHTQVVDLNNDQFPDLITDHYILLNQGITSLPAKPSAPSNLSHIINTKNKTIDLYWEHNDQSSNYITYNLELTKGDEVFIESFSHDDGSRKFFKNGNMGKSKRLRLHNLENGQYSWKVQALLNETIVSEFSGSATFNIDFGEFDSRPLSADEHYDVVLIPENDEYFIVYQQDSAIYLGQIDAKYQQSNTTAVQISSSLDSAYSPYINYHNDIIHIVYNTANGVVYKQYNNQGTLIDESLVVDSLRVMADIHFFNDNLIIPLCHTTHTVEFYPTPREIEACNIGDPCDSSLLFDNYTTKLYMGIVNGNTLLNVHHLNTIKDFFMVGTDPDCYDNFGRTLDYGSKSNYRHFNASSISIDENEMHFLLSYEMYKDSAFVLFTSGADCVPYYYVTHHHDGFKLDGSLQLSTLDLSSVDGSNPFYITDSVGVTRLVDATILNVLEYNEQEKAELYTTQINRLQYNPPLNTYDIQHIIKENSSLGLIQFNPVHAFGTYSSVLDEYIVGWQDCDYFVKSTRDLEDSVLNFKYRRYYAYDDQPAFDEEFLLTNKVGKNPILTYNKKENDFLLTYQDRNDNIFYEKISLPKFLPPIVKSTSLTIADSTYAAYAGDTLIIYGDHFGRTPWTNTVHFGLIQAVVIDEFYDFTKLKVVVPDGLTRDKVAIKVTFDDQTGSSEGNFMFEALTLPTVDSLSAYEGEHGDTITMYGDKFAISFSQMEIRMGSHLVVNTDTISASINQIKFKVPQEIARGIDSVSVTIQGQKVNAPLPFRTIIPPVITFVNKQSGVSCEEVKIQGTNFTKDKSKLQVQFGNVIVPDANITSNHEEEIVLRVPFGVQGPVEISVTTDDRTAIYTNNKFVGHLGGVITDSLHTSFVSFINGFGAAPTGISVLSSCSVDSVVFWYKTNVLDDWTAGDVITDINKYSRIDSVEMFETTTELAYYYEVFDKSGWTFSTSPKTIRRQLLDAIYPLTGEPGDTIRVVGKNMPTLYGDINIKLGDYKISEQDFVVQRDSIYLFTVPSDLDMGKYPISASLRQVSFPVNLTFELFIQPELIAVTSSGPTATSGNACDTIFIRGTALQGADFDPEVYLGNHLLENNEILSVSSDSIVIKPPLGMFGNYEIMIKVREHTLTYSELFTIVNDAKYADYGYREDRHNKGAQAYNDAIIDITSDKSSIDVWVKARDICTVKDMVLLWKEATKTEWKVRGKMLEGDDEFIIDLDQTHFPDPIGTNIACVVSDHANNLDTVFLGLIRKNIVHIDSTEYLSNDITFGTSMSNYHIVSFPYEYDVPKVSLVLQDLYDTYGYNIKKWRFYTFDEEQQKTIEYDDFENVEPGQAYWLIAKHQQEINIAGGATVNVSEGPFSIMLHQGWNMIGNPYTFDVSWQAVKDANPEVASELRSLKTFENGALKETTLLKTYSGGFLYWEGTENTTLVIPYQDAGSGGRTSQGIDGWQVRFNMQKDDLTNNMHALGISGQATDGFDVLDDKKVPVLFDIPYMQIGNQLAIDMRSEKENEVWKISLNDRSMLRWNIENRQLLDGRKLILFDGIRQIDMLNISTHQPAGHDLQVLFGDEKFIEENINIDQIRFGEPFPNPFTAQITIPFALRQSEKENNIHMYIYDNVGKLVSHSEHNTTQKTGTLLWDGKSEKREVPQGIYFIKIAVNDNMLDETLKVLKSE